MNNAPLQSDPRLLEILRSVADSNISTRSYLESVIEEHDKLYDMRFRASEIALSAALASAEKAVAAAFLASEKAIGKAEEAQHDYNIHSNAFHGQLDDQAKTLMPRAESTVLFQIQDERLETTTTNMDAKLDVIRKAIEKNADEIAKEVRDLQEARSEGVGKSAGVSMLWVYLIGGVGAAAALSALIAHFIGK